jgi:hypothetical protein
MGVVVAGRIAMHTVMVIHINTKFCIGYEVGGG